MDKREKERFREDFFKRAGESVRYLVRMFEDLPNVGFYLKDAEQRLVAINRYNRTNCNILDELDAPRKIGVSITDSNLLVPSKSVTAICEIC